MTTGDENAYFFAEDPETAHRIWELIVPYAGDRPGDPRARLVAPGAESEVEVTAPFAEVISKVAYLMARGHAVVVEPIGVDDTVSIDDVAVIVMQRPQDVRDAVRNGLLVTAPHDPHGVLMRDALLYRNHVQAERRLLLDEIHGLDDD